MAEPDVDLARWPARDVPGLMRVIGAMPGRRLAVPGTMNFRDAGGYPAAGGMIRQGRLFRSDSLHRTADAAVSVLRPLGLRTVVDLRTSYEAEVSPSPDDSLAALGAVTMHISLIGEDLAGLPGTLGEIYEYVIDKQGPLVAAAVRCLARPGALPALVHCSAGKDRTGIVLALTLSALGVPDHVVAADYALTSLYLDPQHTPTIGMIQESTGLGDRLTADLMASPPELILTMLDRVRQRSGSVTGYLTGHGVSEAELDRLRAGLVTGG